MIGMQGLEAVWIELHMLIYLDCFVGFSELLFIFFCFPPPFDCLNILIEKLSQLTKIRMLNKNGDENSSLTFKSRDFWLALKQLIETNHLSKFSHRC